MPPRKTPKPFTEIVQDWLQEQVELLGEPGRMLRVTLIRLGWLAGLVVLLKMLLWWNGNLPQNVDTSFVVSILLALFAIVLSWAFFHSAQTASDATTQQLMTFLKDMRQENRNLLTKGGQGIPDEIARTAEQAAESPFDQVSRFKLISSLTSEMHRQFIILLHRQNGIAEPQRNPWHPSGFIYELKSKTAFQGGSASIDEIKRALAGTELLRVELPDRITLTELGNRFAEWLVSEGLQADYFKCDYGGWGQRPSEFDELYPPINQFGTPRPATGPVGGAPRPAPEKSPDGSVKEAKKGEAGNAGAAGTGPTQ